MAAPAGIRECIEAEVGAGPERLNRAQALQHKGGQLIIRKK
jgi:hypothetical protein